MTSLDRQGLDITTSAVASFMVDATRELVRAWLIKARNDLDTASQISTLPDGHFD